MCPLQGCMPVTPCGATPQITLGTDPVGLPEDLVLICGQRAWKSIPARALGGPWDFGQLTFFHPDILPHNRAVWQKQDIHQVSESCNSNTEFWNKAQRVSASLFSSVGTAHALTTLKKLDCCLTKEAKSMSPALGCLLTDVSAVRHASLQNRAASDFFLLAQGHGCQDFKGMCCMNLSDHSESIHTSSSRASLGCLGAARGQLWPWAWQDAAVSPALGHCDCCDAGCWPCDMGVTGPPGAAPLPPLSPAPFGGALEVLSPRVSVPMRPRGLSLPLVARCWAQLLDVPDTSFAIHMVYRFFVGCFGFVGLVWLVCGGSFRLVGSGCFGLGWLFVWGWFRSFALGCLRLVGCLRFVV